MSASLQPASADPRPPPGGLSIESESNTRYIARQPILDREQNTCGYELLFRSGPENFFGCNDPDLATRNTIDFSLLFGSSALTGGHPGFINCTRNILLCDVITLLPRDLVVDRGPGGHDRRSGNYRGMQSIAPFGLSDRAG